jgi:hypothetical protein
MRGASPAAGMLANALLDTDHEGLDAAMRQFHKYSVKGNILRYLINQSGIDQDAVVALETTDNLMPPHKMVMLPSVANRLRHTDADAGALSVSFCLLLSISFCLLFAFADSVLINQPQASSTTTRSLGRLSGGSSSTRPRTGTSRPAPSSPVRGSPRSRSATRRTTRSSASTTTPS